MGTKTITEFDLRHVLTQNDLISTSIDITNKYFF